MNKNRKRVTGRVIATACTGLMLMQGVVTPTVLAAELPGSAIEANAYGESSTFTLDSTVKKIKLYETVHLQATLNSKNVEDRYLKWECDNANVANVSNGYITGMNTGRTNITVTYLPTGETAHCQLTVGTIPGEDGNEFKLDSSEKKIKLYETIQLKALAGDDVVQDRDLKWESSNKDVANVNNGYVTGMNNGKTTITVTYVPTGLTATCELTVGTIPGENGAEFKIDSSTKAIRLWETVQLKAMAGDDVMADKDIKWESSNPSVATVNNGYVSGISVGTTTIKATYLPSGLVATCEVAVSKDGSVTPEPTPGPGPEDPDPIVNPEVNFTLDANVKTVKVGKTNRILAKVDGKNAATKDLEFSVDKPEIATVNSLGVITGVAAGKATVTVTYKPTGQTAVCQVAVEKDQDAPIVLEGEVAVDKKVVALKEGETTKVVATVGGKAVDTKDLKFVSDKTDVAIVRNDGTILGRKAGKAKVTVTYVPTGKTAEVMVAVEAKETAPEVLEGELVLDQKVVTVEAGKTAKVTATINGKEVPRTDLKWTADKSEIAVVRNDGVILGVKEGKAKVTVTYVPTGKTAEVMVAVTKAQETPVVVEGELALDKKVVTVKEGETTKVVATVGGKTVDKKDLKFVSDKTDVAIVRNDGTILGLKAGKAKVTVTYVPTGKTADVMVAVEAKETAPEVLEGELVLDQKVVAVEAGKTAKVTATINGKEVPRTDLKWTADKSDIAVVRNDGVILGVKEGKAKVTVTYAPTGKTADVMVAVTAQKEVLEGEISLDKSYVELQPKDVTKVTATINGKEIPSADYKWTTSNPNVATVKGGGILAVAPGKATITVTYKPTGQTASVAVVVKDAQAQQVDFALDANVKTVKVGKTNRILAKVDGKNAAIKDLEFSVDKPEVATVNNMGVITGVAAGKAKVTVTYKPTGQTAVCQIAVEKDQEEQVEFTLDANVKTVKVGKTNRILAKIDGKNAATKDLEFSVDKPEVATVNNMGVITGVAAGKAKITVTYKPTGQTAVCQIAVEKDQETPEVLEGELVLDQKVVAVEAGKTAKVTATIGGKEVPSKDLKWTADKTDLVVVRNDGVILGVKEGKAKVTVTYVPTGKTADVMVAVTAQKEVLEGEISLDKSYVELQPKDVTKVTATINGKEIPSADYKWTTSNPNVATVKGGGILAVAPGKATITVTYKPTGKTASVAVVVKDAQAQQVDFALDANVKTVKVGKTNRILAKVDGKNAAIKDLEFSVDKPEVATVNNMGVITGVAAGKAKVTVTYKPTGQTAECQIAVEKDQEAVVTGITFDSKIKSVDVGKTTRVLVKVNGQNAKLDDLAFSVDYEQYATVNKMGVITGVKRGRCVVTVTYLPTGETAKLPVSVH